MILSREIGVVKKEKSKTKYLLGLKHSNIPMQLDLGKRGNIQGEGTDNDIRILKTRIVSKSFI